MEATTTARRNGSSDTQKDLKLPGIPDVQNTGTRVVRRVVGLTFLVLAVLIGAALLIGSLVSIDLTIDARGTLEPVHVVPVRAQETATIASIPVMTGDTVSSRQVLARMDSLQVDSELSRLRAQRNARWIALQRAQASQPIERQRQSYQQEQAEADLIRAKANLREQLANYGYSTDVDEVLDTYTTGTHIAIDRALAEVIRARSNVNSAEMQQSLIDLNRFDIQQQRAEIEQLDAQIGALAQRLDRLTVRSPTEGVVLTERIERLPGRLVQQGETLFEVAELDEWRVQLLVGERDVHEIQPGDSAKVEIVAFQSEKKELIRGTVTSVASEPIGRAGQMQGRSAGAAPAAGASGQYRVTIHLAESEIEKVGRDRLRQGYSVEGKIITSHGRIVSLLWRYLRRQAE